MTYYLFFVATSILALAGNYKFKNIVVTILIIALALFAGSRTEIAPDFKMYKNFFRFSEDSYKDFVENNVTLEPIIYIIPNFLKLFFGSKTDIINGSFLCFAFLGVATKLIALKKYANNFFLGFIIYFTYLYLMMEMITIRAGIAGGVFLLSLPYLYKGMYKKSFLMMCLAMLFHTSSVIFFVIFFLMRLNINIKYYYYSLLLSFILIATKVNLLTLLLLDRVFPKVKAYLDLMEKTKEEDVNIFSFRILIALFMTVFLGFYYDKLKKIEGFEVLFRIHIISLFLFFSFSVTASVFSIRTFELLSVVQLLLFPMLTYAFAPKFKYIAWVILIVFSLAQLYYMIDISEFFEQYKSWLF